jgi:hypothetical protein
MHPRADDTDVDVVGPDLKVLLEVCLVTLTAFAD